MRSTLKDPAGAALRAALRDPARPRDGPALRGALVASACLSLGLASSLASVAASAQPRNVVVILSDDHRYDFMGFHPDAPAFLQTPNLDRMAAEGAHLANAFVTTQPVLAEPRVSILTGQYAHNHGVVDNTSPIPEGTRFFPQDLQAGGLRDRLRRQVAHGRGRRPAPRRASTAGSSFRGQGALHRTRSSTSTASRSSTPATRPTS